MGSHVQRDERLRDLVAEGRSRSERIVTEAQKGSRPKLVFVYSKTSGPSRKSEAYMAQVLQRRHNHDTFNLVRVCVEEQPELLERLRVRTVPAILVVEGKTVRARLELAVQRSKIEQTLRPWLR